MNRQRLERAALGLIAVAMVPAGLQATFAPRSFFDDFPLGRGWITHGAGAFDEHLVRDVGGLYLALIVVTGWTAGRGGPTRAVAIAWVVQGSLHLAFHAGHLDGYAAVDQVGLIASLMAIPVLALAALWAGRATSEASRR